MFKHSGTVDVSKMNSNGLNMQFNSQKTLQLGSPMLRGTLGNNGGLNIFNKNATTTPHNVSSPPPGKLDLDTIDGTSLAEESSEDDDMGDYDYNIETNRIVKTRRHASMKS